jgi:DNA polymerase III delta prime subunit
MKNIVNEFKKFYPSVFEILKLGEIANLLIESDFDTLNVIKEMIMNFYDPKASLQSSDVLLVDSNPITIETSRYIRNFISFKPDNLKYRFVIIVGMENMTSQAANSLLKSLEESKPYVIFISFTTNSNNILKTILSRAFNFKLNPIFLNDIDDEIVRSINGSFGRYLAWMNNTKYKIEISNIEDAVETYLRSFLDENPLYFIDRDKAFNYLQRFKPLDIFSVFEAKISKLQIKSVKNRIITDLSERLVDIDYSRLEFVLNLKHLLEFNLNFLTVLLILLNKLNGEEKI